MKRNVLIGAIAAVVAVVLIWYFVLYKPLGEDLTSTQAQVSEEQTKTDDLQATLTRLQSQAKNSTEQQALLNKLDKAVPEQPDLAEFIIEINQIAEEAGIDFLTISPAPPAAGTGASVIGLTITIKGSFFQLQDYLRLLEQMDRLVVIDGFNVAGGASSTSGDTTGEGTQLSVTLTGRMFTRAAPAATSDGSTAPAPGTSSTTAPAGTGESTSTTAPAASATTGGT